MCRCARRLTGLALLLVALGANGAQDAPWYERAWQPVQEAYEKGTLEIYLPLRIHHLRSAYSRAKIDGFQETPPGLGVGRGRYDERGNWHGVYAMGYHDSHFKPQWSLGYAWKTFWPAGAHAKLGLGYTAALMAREDIGHYTPFPVLVPIGSLSYKGVGLEAAYVPGLRDGTGNILFFWAKWESGR